MQQADISKVRASVHQQCGSKVMIQLDRGRGGFNRNGGGRDRRGNGGGRSFEKRF